MSTGRVFRRATLPDPPEGVHAERIVETLGDAATYIVSTTR